MDYNIEASNAYAIHYKDIYDIAYLDGFTPEMVYAAMADTINNYEGRNVIPSTYEGK